MNDNKLIKQADEFIDRRLFSHDEESLVHQMKDRIKELSTDRSKKVAKCKKQYNMVLQTVRHLEYHFEKMHDLLSEMNINLDDLGTVYTKATKEMKTYRVERTFRYGDFVDVEANSREEAEYKAKEALDALSYERFYDSDAWEIKNEKKGLVSTEATQET